MVPVCGRHECAFSSDTPHQPRILWPRFQFQIAGADCTFPAVSPCVFWRRKPRTFFLPPSNSFMNSLLCGEAPLKAASVPASMCALYSCVCVYASASYGCFPPWPRPGCGSRRAPECCLCAILISGEVSGSKNVQRYCGNSALLPAP